MNLATSSRVLLGGSSVLRVAPSEVLMEILVILELTELDLAALGLALLLLIALELSWSLPKAA